MTITEIKKANKGTGGHWFDPDTMRFFGSRILPTVYGGTVFITSEYTGFDRTGRAYTVRQFIPETGEVNKVGEFLGYATRAEAVKAAKAASK